MESAPWYALKVAMDPDVLKGHADKLEVLYPGRYEIRLKAAENDLGYILYIRPRH